MSKRSITVVFEFPADADPEQVNETLNLAVQQIGGTASEFTAEQVEKWGKWEGAIVPADNVLVTRQQTLNERLAMARVLGEEPIQFETVYSTPEAAAAAATL